LKLINYITKFIYDFFDIFPPYVIVEGLLEGKEHIEGSSEYRIHISSQKIEVDSYTFDILMIGETLKVRHTRSNKAINIDRLIPEQGPV